MSGTRTYILWVSLWDARAENYPNSRKRTHGNLRLAAEITARSGRTTTDNIFSGQLLFNWAGMPLRKFLQNPARTSLPERKNELHHQNIKWVMLIPGVARLKTNDGFQIAACLKRARTVTPDPWGIDPTVEIDSLASLVDLPDS